MTSFGVAARSAVRSMVPKRSARSSMPSWSSSSARIASSAASNVSS
jgi:hypothetical protein